MLRKFQQNHEKRRRLLLKFKYPRKTTISPTRKPSDWDVHIDDLKENKKSRVRGGVEKILARLDHNEHEGPRPPAHVHQKQYKSADEKRI